MDHDARENAPAGLEPVTIGPGREDDLPGIVDILNHTIVNSNATLTTQLVGVPDRRVGLHGKPLAILDGRMFRRKTPPQEDGERSRRRLSN